MSSIGYLEVAWVKVVVCTLLALFLTTVAASAQLVEIQSVRAWAPTSMVKPICVEVKVCNRGDKTVTDGTLNLTLTPDVRAVKNSSAGMLDPRQMDLTLEPLKPGETQIVSFQTPYFSRSAFSSGNGVIRVENIIPGICQWTTIAYQVFLVGPPGQFCQKKRP